MHTRIQVLWLAAALSWAGLASAAIPLENRLELFVDDFLVERLDDVALKLHEPVLAGVALRFDQPRKSGPDVSPLAGQPVKLRCVMKDAGLYSLRFRP
jgi:hypothetical protein